MIARVQYNLTFFFTIISILIASPVTGRIFVNPGKVTGYDVI